MTLRRLKVEITRGSFSEGSITCGEGPGMQRWGVITCTLFDYSLAANLPTPVHPVLGSFKTASYPFGDWAPLGPVIKRWHRTQNTFSGMIQRRAIICFWQEVTAPMDR